MFKKKGCLFCEKLGKKNGITLKVKLFIYFLEECLIPWAFVSMFWREKKRICGNFIVPFGDGNH